MEIIPHEDFSHTVILDSGVEILFRELIGSDIYFIELFRETDDDHSFLASSEFLHEMMIRLSCEPNKIDFDTLTDLIYHEYHDLMKWFCENRLVERIMGLNDWLTLCFHLSKQRWTSDLDWFESQPIIKIIQMSSIQTDFHEKVNAEMKKGAKKK